MSQSCLSTFGSICGGKHIFLSLGEKQILKPLSEKQCLFYEWINNLDNPQVKEPVLKIIPQYHGKFSISPTQNLNLETRQQWVQHLIETKYSVQKDKQNYLVLENLLSGMSKPSILDLKIGIRYKSQKFTQKFVNCTTPTHNFRMCGVKVYQPIKNKTVFKDKYYHQTIGADKIALNFAHFFYDGQKLNLLRIQNAICQIQKIIEAYKQLQGVKIESLSLFLAYDGEKQDNTITAKLIDFDLHTIHQHNQIDQNRLKGLVNIKLCLEEILSTQKQLVQGIKQRDDL